MLEEGAGVPLLGLLGSGGTPVSDSLALEHDVRTSHGDDPLSIIENEINVNIISPRLRSRLLAIVYEARATRDLLAKSEADLRQHRQTIARLHEQVAEQAREIARLRTETDPVEFAIASWTDARRRLRA